MSSFAYLYERFPSFVQTFVYREALEMVRQGMEPRLISIRRPEDPPELEEKFAAEIWYLPESAELRAEADRLRLAGKLPGKVRRAIPEARKLTDANRLFEAIWLGPRLKEQGIGHVHAHFGGMAARTAWWLRKLYGISYSFTGHANDIFCEHPFPVTNADLVRDARFVVTETDFARLWMENKYPRSTGKFFRVFNGIDRQFPERQPAGEVPRILSVGRYVEKKGFGDLIEACRRLRGGGVAFECLIVGGGPLEAALQAQIDAAGLDECVRLLGPKSQEDVRALLAAAQVFALACVPEAGGGSDNLPTVIMEAMMAGVPVVSTRLAGVPEMIDHGQNGLLVTPGDPQALALAIEEVAGDSALARKFSEASRKTAVSLFSVETTTRSLKHLLVRVGGVRAPAGAFALDPQLPRSWWSRWRGGPQKQASKAQATSEEEPGAL